MAQNSTVYLIAATGGIVCQDTGGQVKGYTANRSSKNQQWSVEYGQDQTQVAFRNAATGNYLRTNSGTRGASSAIKTGSKQWWTLHEGTAPGSCWIQCNDYPNMYLCNSYGNHTDNNVIWCWNKDPGYAHTMLWYFRDGSATGFTQPASGGNSQALEAREKALLAKEQAIEQRAQHVDRQEQAIMQKQQDLEAENASLKKQIDQLDAKAKELQEAEKARAAERATNSQDETQVQKLRQKSQQLDRRDRELATREKAPELKEQQLEEKQAKQSPNHDSIDADAKQTEAKDASLQPRVEAKDEEITKARPTSSSAASLGSNTADDEDLRKQIAELQDKLKRMETQVAQARKGMPTRLSPVIPTKDPRKSSISQLPPMDHKLVQAQKGMNAPIHSAVPLQDPRESAGFKQWQAAQNGKAGWPLRKFEAKSVVAQVRMFCFRFVEE